jgi:uncharacterized membrane protein HdeD (DUF308 family)
MADTQVHRGLDGPFAGRRVLRSLAQNWWLLLLRGIAATAFGTLAFFWPGLTLLTLTLLWGAYSLSDGIFALFGRDIRNGRRNGVALVAGASRRR